MEGYQRRIPKLSAEELFLGVLLGEKPVDCRCPYCGKRTRVGRRVNVKTIICPTCFNKELHVRHYLHSGMVKRGGKYVYAFKQRRRSTKWPIGQLAPEDEELFASMRGRLGIRKQV